MCIRDRTYTPLKVTVPADFPLPAPGNIVSVTDARGNVLSSYIMNRTISGQDVYKRQVPALYDQLVQRLPGALAKKFDQTVFGAVKAPGSNFDTLKACTAQSRCV